MRLRSDTLAVGAYKQKGRTMITRVMPTSEGIAAYLEWYALREYRSGAPVSNTIAFLRMGNSEVWIEFVVPSMSTASVVYYDDITYVATELEGRMLGVWSFEGIPFLADMMSARWEQISTVK